MASKPARQADQVKQVDRWVASLPNLAVTMIFTVLGSVLVAIITNMVIEPPSALDSAPILRSTSISPVGLPAIKPATVLTGERWDDAYASVSVDGEPLGTFPVARGRFTYRLTMPTSAGAHVVLVEGQQSSAEVSVVVEVPDPISGARGIVDSLPTELPPLP